MIKKLIVCIILIATILFTFCSCYPSTTDEQGVERIVIDNNFVIINYSTNYSAIVYHQNTKVVYYVEYGSYGGYLSPYLIYQDGYIYGAVFENGQIIPVPYAFAPLN
jgi:hypothetical protein